MGLTCARHQNTGDNSSVVCQKSLDFGRDSLSEEAAVLGLKRWAYAGRDLRGASCRSDHVRINARLLCSSGVTETVLDEWALALT